MPPADGSAYHVILISQLINGIVLAFVLIFMLLLANDPDLIGEHVNARWYNASRSSRSS